jgi:hypothetical protein
VIAWLLRYKRVQKCEMASQPVAKDFVIRNTRISVVEIKQGPIHASSELDLGMHAPSALKDRSYM